MAATRPEFKDVLTAVEEVYRAEVGCDVSTCVQGVLDKLLQGEEFVKAPLPSLAPQPRGVIFSQSFFCNEDNKTRMLSVAVAFAAANDLDLQESTFEMSPLWITMVQDKGGVLWMVGEDTEGGGPVPNILNTW